MKKIYTQSVTDVLKTLGVDAQGLTTAQAQERLAKYGPNKLKEAPKPTLLQRFLAQLKDPMLIILMIAAAVSALTGMLAGENEWAEVIIILAVVLLNAILGVFQESKAEAAIEALQTMTAATCKVLRDGKLVGEYVIEDLPRVQLVAKMMGKELDDMASIRRDDGAAFVSETTPVLEAHGLSSTEGIAPFDFSIHEGEVNGFTGLLGSGRSECVRAIFGADRKTGGTVSMDGKEVKISKPLDAMKQGIGYLPEDRKRDGIVAGAASAETGSAAGLDRGGGTALGGAPRQPAGDPLPGARRPQLPASS